jgi:hypothetical protein
MRPIAARHGLSMLQLACAWNLAQPGVRCVAPTLIQESGAQARPVEDKRAELAELTALLAGASDGRLLSEEEVRAIREIGDNAGCMALKGASLEHEGPSLADRWPLDDELEGIAARWGIDPASQLNKHVLSAG